MRNKILANFGKKQSKETIEKRRLKLLGHEVSEKTRMKISKSCKGRKSPMKGKKHKKSSIIKMSNSQKENARKNPNFGMKNKKHSKSTKKKISLKAIGRKHTTKTKNKISINNARGFLGKKHKKETIIKFTKTKKRLYSSGKLTPPWSNKKRSEEDRKKMSAGKQEIPLNKWKKFISREPYDQNWDNIFKRRIRKRDNQICMICGIHREKLKEALAVHHINYDKQLSIPQNCISLCRSCHGLTQVNKKHYKVFFQLLLSEKHNYLYSEVGDVILEVRKNG